MSGDIAPFFKLKLKIVKIEVGDYVQADINGTSLFGKVLNIACGRYEILTAFGTHMVRINKLEKSHYLDNIIGLYVNGNVNLAVKNY